MWLRTKYKESDIITHALNQNQDVLDRLTDLLQVREISPRAYIKYVTKVLGFPMDARRKYELIKQHGKVRFRDVMALALRVLF